MIYGVTVKELNDGGAYVMKTIKFLIASGMCVLGISSLLFVKVSASSVVDTNNGKFKLIGVSNIINNQADKDIENAMVTLDKDSFEYTGNPIEPKETVIYEGTKLVEGKDYKKEYSYNIDALGPAYVTITGIGNYKGVQYKRFDITPISLLGARVTLENANYVFDGFAKKPEVHVEFLGKQLKKDDDYSVEYSNNINAGKAKVTIIGKRNYTGTLEKEYNIDTHLLDDVKIEFDKETYIYDGQPKTPNVIVRQNGIFFIEDELGNYSYCELVRGTDYTIEYCNNTAIGEASVLISGIGNYSGSVTRTFDIVNDEGFAKKEGVTCFENLDYTFAKIDGSNVETKTNGVPKVIIFFQTTCGSCNGVFNSIAKNADLYTGFDILAVDVNDKGVDEVKEYADGYGNIPVTFCVGGSKAAFQYLNLGETDRNLVLGTPYIVYVNEDNLVVYRRSGYVSDLSKYINTYFSDDWNKSATACYLVEKEKQKEKKNVDEDKEDDKGNENDRCNFLISSGAEYTICDGENAVYNSPVNIKKTSYVIPDTIRLTNGKKVKVTGIDRNAFCKCKKLKKITIGKNVNKIGERVFLGCSKLKQIKINSTKLVKNSFGKDSFKGINKNATITMSKKQYKNYKKWIKKAGAPKTTKYKKQ